MWRLSHIICHSQLWFSDGLPLEAERGTDRGQSERLIVDSQGFLDLTTTTTVAGSPTVEDEDSLHWEIIANGEALWANRSENTIAACPPFRSVADPVELALRIDGKGNFELSLDMSPLLIDCYDTSGRVSGQLAPLPTIDPSDIEFIDRMIEDGIIPYQNIPVLPGRPMDEITALGKRLFPFTPHSFQLALCIYDWTTASFTRLVLLKIFEYTGLPPTPLFPFDRDSVAEMIWASNWPPYTPQDVDYMRSFLMEPASSLEEVHSQLATVGDELHQLSDVQNRLIEAALYSLPRTSILSSPVLFSGQMDISQLGLDHFGIEFLECPLNDGPASRTLVSSFNDAVSSYIAPGHTVTTKTAWSFTDRLEDAVNYANGILLVLHPRDDSWVWDEPTFITPLSDDPAKNEYVSAPGTRFLVSSVDDAGVLGKEMKLITLQIQ